MNRLAWLSRYAKIIRKMNRQHFMFYLLYICDHNHREERKLKNSGCLNVNVKDLHVGVTEVAHLVYVQYN